MDGRDSVTDSALQVFPFEQSVVLRAGATPEGIAYVIAADVCAVAGHGNVSQALARLDDDEKGLISNDTPGGKQSLAYVTESGFYALVLTFRLRKDHPNYAQLKRFRKWVTSKVLPAIRQTGRYEEQPAPGPPAIQNGDARLRRLDVISEMLVSIREVVEQQIEQEQRLTVVESKADAALASASGDTGFVTVLGYCNIHGIKLDRAGMARAGAALTKACEAAGIPTRKAPHEIYGRVGLYPVELLDRWAERFKIKS
jgi:prophage antirepressor-like protein